MKNRLNQRTISVAVFSAMFIFLLMQFHHVMVYFDDYGYYSLSYGVNTSVDGHHFGFDELISYLKVHYFEVNGRIPGYLLWLSLYILGGLPLVQVSAAVFVISILIAIWMFVGEKKHQALSAVLVCAFYGFISLNMHHQGTYWFAAFFQYVAPVLFIVLFVLLYFKWRDDGFTLGKISLLSLLTFFAAYSQEQLSVTVTFMMCLLFGFELLNKKVGVHHFLFVTIAALGVAALLLSPSSQNRAASTGYTFLETIIYSTYKTLRTFFAADISIFVILLYLSLLIFSLEMMQADRSFLKLMDVGGIALSIASIAIYLFKPLLRALGGMTYERYYVLITAGVPCVAVIALQIMRYYWSKQKYSKLLLFMTAVGSVGCLCFVPEVPARLFLSSWLLLFPLLADGLFTLYRLLAEKYDKCGIGLFGAFCIILVFLSSVNMIRIYNGYADNARIFRYNDQILSVAAENEKNGNPQDQVILKKLSDSKYAAAVVYNEEVTYMKYWMKNYYGFENMPSLYFNDTGTPDTQLDLYIDQGNRVYVIQ